MMGMEFITVKEGILIVDNFLKEIDKGKGSCVLLMGVFMKDTFKIIFLKERELL